ncbi:dihydroxy-acid dehydratase [Verminephrobacter eiseniae]|nr:dihydroxy-acid dehydratase [Verminephrobacter eiseniae]MCW5232263.1 dihydroxy-acid dehydratase [Verminephrobacter eiseniae]MCW5296174.1 dihydroxy-acid dehydratase [Verminephrobacter eiseniae]MCW8185427.1 dihydroxy-acid dehydratase [Verminephrobacter eiseniae]MCW8224098.1 dihydroxy-acid dehydratase [Verminephrobacter eiseniae]MCW8235224.1 dihydroxy-acid dehydratase [Verminephrobacter eiseniae]
MPHDPSHEAPTAPLGFERGLTNYGDRDFALYLRRFFLKSMGYSGEILRRPVIGIASSPSGYNNCHRAMPELVEAVKRGVLAAGALPIDFPTISLGESFLTPTSLMFRNLMSMDVEEMVRAQPMDAVVLIGGCDKTVPAQLMGAAAADVPAVQLVTGPMMTGRHEGERLGACTDCRRFWASFRAGTTSSGQIEQIEGRLATTAGTCAVMGTASTMACIAEALGMSLPGTAMIPAVHADRLRAAEASGAAAVRLAHQPIRPREIITSKSVENAVRVLLALGGSTNAIIHLTAIAGRLGLQVSLQRLNELSESTPVLVNLKPSGAHYMEDFHAAGGMGGLLRELAPLLHLDTLTVTGETLGERLAAEGGTWADPGIVRPLRDPIEPKGGLVALYGNLAPAGAILKRSAADKRLFEKEGRVVLFDSLEDLAERIDDPDLDVTADDILVLCNAGPKSASGMPEAGYLPIPKKLAQQGVKDMVRISDARMSGTAFGTIVLHVSPEAAAGGPLALVKNGDRIRLSVEHRSLELLVSDEELRRRHADIVAAPIGAQRGYARLYREHVLQADGGCDFDFLQAVALHAPRDGR